jgi:general secretion pathway protein D
VKKKTSLTLFVTPHIVRNSEDLEKIYQQKIKDRDLFLKAFYGEKYQNQDFYSQLPKEEAGKAPVPKKTHSLSEQTALPTKQEHKSSRKHVILPSEDPNPINAPSTHSGGGGGASGTPQSAPARVAPAPAPAPAPPSHY